MEYYVYWFLTAFVLLIMEMASGTFYMFMLSAAFGVGGFAALSGLNLPAQMSLAAVVSVIGILVLRRVRTNKSSQELDIGQKVQIVTWREDGTARVRYRGAEWDAEIASPDAPREAAFYIKEIHGTTLVLTHRM